MKYTAIVQHYYKSRRPYLDQIVDALAASSMPPSELIIWNNEENQHLAVDPSRAKMPTTAINSSKNNLMGRYAAMLLATTDVVFVQDDDLLVQPKTVERLIEAWKRNGSIAGHVGANLDRGSPSPYSSAMWVPGQVGVDISVDIVLGRCFVGYRLDFIPGMQKAIALGNPGRCDDIHFNMCNDWSVVARVSGNGDDGIVDLDEHGEGLSHDPSHFIERDRYACMMISLEEAAAKTALNSGAGVTITG